MDELNGTQEIEKAADAVKCEDCNVRNWNEQDRLLQVQAKRQRWSKLRVTGGADDEKLQHEEDELGQ